MISSALPASSSETIDYLRKRGRLKLLSGVMAAESLQDHADRQAKNMEAEEAFVRRTAWGAKEPGMSTEEEMRQTVLGDHTETHHHYPPTPKPGLLRPLLLALAASTGIGLPVAVGLALPAILEALRPAQTAPAPVVDPGEPILLPGRPLAEGR
jgi:hypothetical protein